MSIKSELQDAASEIHRNDNELVQDIDKKISFLTKINVIMDLARLNNSITIAEVVENPACLPSCGNWASVSHRGIHLGTYQ